MESNSKNTADENQEKLPEVLKKLQIVQLMPTIRLPDNKLPLVLNPFFFQAKSKDKDEGSSNLFGSKCKCSSDSRRNNIEHSIINRTKFKHNKQNSNLRRIYLKESILKTCCCDELQKDCSSLSRNRSSKSILELSDYPTLEDLRLEDDCLRSNTAATNRRQSSTGQLNQNFLDFHIQFIKDCGISSRHSNSNKNNLNNSTSLAESKNFTTLQSSDDRLITKKRIFKKNISNVSKQQNSNTINNSIQNSNSNLSSSSSCSKQARNNNSSTTTCDITIDELACYFETFVHIPKKMSTMAEMMYI